MTGYTIILLVPDYLADSFGQDTQVEYVDADLREAVEVARHNAYVALTGEEPHEHTDLTDFYVLGAIKGEHTVLAGL